MAADLFSSLSALVTGTVTAAKAVVTELIPPAATLAGDIVSWLLYYLRAAVAVALDTTLPPHAAAVARDAAQAAQPFVAVALRLLGHLWTLSSAAVAEAARFATATMLPAAVALVESAVRASWPWVDLASNRVRELYGLLLPAVHELPGVAQAVKDMVESAVQGSQPLLEQASKILRAFRGWLVDVSGGEEPPDVAQAAKNAARAVAQVSRPWLDTVSKQLRDLYGWVLATAAETKLKADDAANAGAGAVASEKLIPCDAPAARMVESTADAVLQNGHGWSWLLHDRGVAVYVYVVLALALLAVAFICGGICALTLRSRILEQEDHGDWRRSHPQRQRHHD